MALNPIDEVHALQIQAGALGRKAGHDFESKLALEINSLSFPLSPLKLPPGNIHVGSPGMILLSFIARHYRLSNVRKATAISTGALATSEAGKSWLSINGASVSRCKSDLVITLHNKIKSKDVTVGVSTKQCNNEKPTNAQIYLSGARAFSKLLIDNGISVSQAAITALRQFCGETGFRPLDNPESLLNRKTDPRRYFWEEIDPLGRTEWENILSLNQDLISRLLLQKAYLNDPFVPLFLLHKTRKCLSTSTVEVAVYGIDELVDKSHKYQGFQVKPYPARSRSFKSPRGTKHLAPRFGVIQMQKSGQAQHPTELQFNLEARYFYKLDKLLNVPSD